MIQSRTIRLDPRSLKLLEVNARYMTHEQYSRLVENVKSDGDLTSVPFACNVSDGAEPEYLVLSGNHRVRAAIDAGLETIEVKVTDQLLDHQRRIALQLSHNAISGQDDQALLKKLYDELDVDWRAYSGLDDQTLELLKQSEADALREANLSFQTFSLVFLPEEIERIQEVFQQAQAFAKGAKLTLLARWSEYDRYMEAMDAVRTANNVQSSATAFLLLLDIAERHMDELDDAWYDADSDSPRHKGSQVPLVAVLGSPNVPGKVAVALRRVVEQMVASGEIEPHKKWDAIDVLCKKYLEK